MRKAYHIVGLVTLVIGLAACYDSSAANRIFLVDDSPAFELRDGFMLSAVPMVELVADSVTILSPKFTSNLCGLVVFPELGSDGAMRGYWRGIRGPPKNL